MITNKYSIKLGNKKKVQHKHVNVRSKLLQLTVKDHKFLALVYVFLVCTSLIIFLTSLSS